MDLGYLCSYSCYRRRMIYELIIICIWVKKSLIYFLVGKVCCLGFFLQKFYIKERIQVKQSTGLTDQNTFSRVGVPLEPFLTNGQLAF